MVKKKKRGKGIGNLNGRATDQPSENRKVDSAIPQPEEKNRVSHEKKKVCEFVHQRKSNLLKNKNNLRLKRLKSFKLSTV